MRYPLLLILMMMTLPAFAQNVVVENFVSEKCGVVPDSEKNLQSITNAQDDVLILTCHLDESLGVSEEIAKACQTRKFQYLNRWFYPDAGSPTIIIDGAHKTRGLYEKIVSSGVNMARAEYDLSQINMRISDGIIIAELPESHIDSMAELWVVAYDYSRSSIISVPAEPDENHVYDENGDHTQTPVPLENIDTNVEFMNVVKAMKRLDSWSGRAETIRIPVNNFEADEFAIIAQGANLGDIIAVGTVARGEVPAN